MSLKAKIWLAIGKLADADGSILPKKALARRFSKFLPEWGEQVPDQLSADCKYVIFEEAQREQKMLTVLLNVGGSGVDADPDFFYKQIGLIEELPEIEKELELLPSMGLTVKDFDASEVIAAIESLIEDKGGYANDQTDVNQDGEDDDETDDDEDDSTADGAKTEYPDNEDDENQKSAEELKRLVRIKSGDRHELSDDLSTVCVKQQFSFSNFGKKSKDDYRPTPSELDEINTKYSNSQLTPMDILVYNLESADMNIDRQHERFTEPALKKMALLSLDKPFLIDHKWETNSQIGKIFAAEYKDGKLHQKVYVLDDASNDKFNKNIMAGIFNKVSVGFSSQMKDMECSMCQKGISIYDAMCPHVAGGEDSQTGQRTHINIKDVSDYYEVSLVPVPAQRDAGIRRRSHEVASPEQLANVVDDAFANRPKAEDCGLAYGVRSENSRRRSVTITAEMLDIMEGRQPAQIISSQNSEIKNLDTINHVNNHLGDTNTVTNATTSASKADEAKTADVFIAPDATAAASAASTEVSATSTETAVAAASEAPAQKDGIDNDTDHEKPSEQEDKHPTASVKDEEGKGTAPQKPDFDTKPRKPGKRKQLRKSVKALKRLVKAMTELVEAQKALAASNAERVQQMELAMEKQDERLKALTGIVEAATKVSIESLERNAAAKAVAQNAVKHVGTDWAVDLTKKLIGGK